MDPTIPSAASLEGQEGRATTVQVTALLEHCTSVLSAAGLGLAEARLVAESLVDAEARGVTSHGVTRTRIYARRLREGLVDPSARPVITARSPERIWVDARNAIGQVGAQTGITALLDGTSDAAVRAAGIANSNHCGTLAYFTRQAAEAGLIAIGMSTAPPTMSYYGSRSRAVGTNPLSIAVPRPQGPPIVLDFATSAAARGKIILAEQLGQEIPAGWAADEAGRPTTDPGEALRGSVLPFAGPKGSGLAMMIELLCGALVAGVTGDGIGDMYDDWSRSQRVSHLFMVLDPDGWVGRAAYQAHVAAFAERVHGLAPAEGFDRVSLPGEVEEDAWLTAERDGVTLSGAVAADLNSLARELGVSGRLGGLSDSP